MCSTTVGFTLTAEVTPGPAQQLNSRSRAGLGYQHGTEVLLKTQTGQQRTPLRLPLKPGVHP